MGFEDNGERKNRLEKAMNEVTNLYTLARPDGIVSVQSINSGAEFENVKQEGVREILSRIEYDAGLSRMPFALKTKILDKFLMDRATSKGKLERPILILVLTDGCV
jgi:hypothetical protein